MSNIKWKKKHLASGEGQKNMEWKLDTPAEGYITAG
jgi:hypothetical protein